MLKAKVAGAFGRTTRLSDAVRLSRAFCGFPKLERGWMV